MLLLLMALLRYFAAQIQRSLTFVVTYIKKRGRSGALKLPRAENAFSKGLHGFK